MIEKIKIAVIGGTGKSGQYLVRQLLKKGLNIKLLLRNPDSFLLKSPLIEIVQGDARDYNSIHSLLVDSQIVLSTLGQPKGESSIFSTATKNVLKAMKTHSIKRYIVTTGLSVNTPIDHKNPKAQFATEWMLNNYPETTKDKQVEYQILSESDIGWTLIRLPLIEQTDEKRELVIDLKDCKGERISATDLADFMIKQITDDTYYQQAPFIANSI